jgi:hypothetical protein
MTKLLQWNTETKKQESYNGDCFVLLMYAELYYRTDLKK